MWEVFIWSPTKGWKLARRFPRKKHAEAAAYALEFTPLEVKLVSPRGRTWVSGRCHIPLEGTPTLNQIESFSARPDELY